MKIEIKDLRDHPVDLEFSWPPRSLELEDPDFCFVGDVQGTVRYTLLGERVLAKGRIAAPVETRCVRCLQNTGMQVTAEVDVVYEHDPELLKDEFELGGPADDLCIYFDGTAIDPVPELREALMAELPSLPLCSEECKGLCPKCGADRNTDPCDCRTEAEEKANSWKAQIGKLKLD